jgi:hypothetical protein
MPPLENVHSGAEWRDSGKASTVDADKIVALDSGMPDLRTARAGDSREIEALRQENAKLERLLRLLRKDVDVKDDYLAVLRRELLVKEAEISRLHQSIAHTLSQPRYRAADALNRALRRVTFLHAFLKRQVAGQTHPDRVTSNVPR